MDEDILFEISDDSEINFEFPANEDPSLSGNGSLPTPTGEQVPVGTTLGTWILKTIDQLKTLLGLGSAAYTESTAYLPADTTFPNDKVKFDSDDPTAGYLSDKLVAGTNISITEGTGADENKAKIALSEDSTHRTVTDTEKSTWNGKQAAMTKASGSDIITGTDDTKYVTAKAIADAGGLGSGALTVDSDEIMFNLINSYRL